MRIAVVTNAYPPDAKGGAGRIAELQVEGLRAHGHDVRVWHVPITWVTQPLWLRLFFHLRDLVRIHPIIDELVTWKPDRVITHNLTGIGFRLPAKLQAQDIPWVHVLHDVQLFEPSGQLFDWSRVTCWQRLWSRLRRWVFGTPKIVLSPTQSLLDAHHKRGFFKKTKTIVLPNPAPPQRIIEHRRHRPMRIVFVGRWTEDKGSLLLSRLWSDPELLRYEWHLIGPGTETLDPPLGKGYGPLSVSRILDLFQEMDVLLVPSSLFENQPTVFLEAMSCGLPVIASRQPGIEETLGSSENLCEVGDAAAWKAALLQVQNESEQRYAMRIQAMQGRWSVYDPVVIIQRLEAVLVTLN